MYFIYLASLLELAVSIVAKLDRIIAAQQRVSKRFSAEAKPIARSLTTSADPLPIGSHKSTRHEGKQP